MYPVSQSFQQAIKLTDRPIWDANIVIESATGTLTLGMDGIQEGSLKLTEKAIPGDTFTIGGAVITQLDFIIKNTGGRFSDTQFYGAVITGKIALMVDGAFEWVPLGILNVVDVSQPTSTIKIGAKNNLCLFDVPFSGVSVSYPSTNLQLLSAICTYCGVPLRSTSFLNSGYIVKSAPESACSCRDIISDIAELAAGFARCARDNGDLEIVSFKNVEHVSTVDISGGTFTDYSQDTTLSGGDFKWYLGKSAIGGVFKDTLTDIQLGTDNRQDFVITNDPVTITGVSFETNAKNYIVGSDFYALDISQNALVADDDIPDILQSIANVMIGYTYLPFTSNWQGNPAVEPGDTVEQTTQDGSVYRTTILASTYVFRGVCNASAGGATQGTQAYQGMTKRYAQLVRNIHMKQVQLDSLQQAIANATSMICGIWGGYVVNGDTLTDEKYHGNIFICDNIGSDPTHPDVTKATKIWRWNLGGFGYSETGIDGPYISAWTADGRIVTNIIQGAMIIAGTITGDRIAAGAITADNIKAATITGDKIQAGTITADNIKGGTITGDKIQAGTINGDKLIAGTVEAAKLTSPSSDIYAEVGGGGNGYAVYYKTESKPFLKFWRSADNTVIISAQDGKLGFCKDDANNSPIGADGTITKGNLSIVVKNGLVNYWSDSSVTGELPIPDGNGYAAYTIHVKDGIITGWG